MIAKTFLKFLALLEDKPNPIVLRLMRYILAIFVCIVILRAMEFALFIMK